jgi:seryl-tRNA synthetase
VLDINKIRSDAVAYAAAIGRRGIQPDFSKIQSLDEQRRRLITETEAQRQELNEAAKNIGLKKKNGEDASVEMAATHVIKESLTKGADSLGAIEAELSEELMGIPNAPLASVPTGAGEHDNVEVLRWGTPKTYGFKPQAHDDLGKALGIMDSELGVQLAKTRFTVLRGSAARLERALINFMLDRHATKGYEEVLAPFLANSKSLTGTGQLPKFSEDLFRIEGEDLYLIPTAEVPLTNMVANSIVKDLDKGQPLKLMAYTPCFRSEAGSYGKDTKGYLRQHQFNKVELVKITHPDDSESEHEKLTQDAEDILQALGLPYRKVCLCTGDMGFSSAKTYDLEVWLPSQETYREISSCSNFWDFQARRAGIRFKDRETKKNLIAHTLNGSGLAVGRTLVAIFENYQTEDGNILIPEALQPYMGGQTSLRS